jgi:D-alanyl-D-alanine carboxypeptidase
MRRTTLALLSAYAGTASAEDVSPLAALMQPTANAKALEYNCSIAIAVAFSNGTSATVVAGEKDMVQHVPAQPSDKFIWGSITKILTGSSILKAQEAGKLKITDPIVPYIDPILKKMAASDPSMKFSSLEDLFGSNVSKVTIENLARMQSGIPDYDTAKPEGSHPTDSFRATCYKDSKRDYAPQDMLGLPWVATKQLDFEPGTKVSYSSTNFVLLGLLLAQLDNATWSTYNQAAIVPPSARDDTVFALTGPPSQWTDVRGYDRTAYNGQDPAARPGVDVSNIDCVYAGWTASDYTASVQNAADFALDVYGAPAR